LSEREEPQSEPVTSPEAGPAQPPAAPPPAEAGTPPETDAATPEAEAATADEASAPDEVATVAEATEPPAPADAAAADVPAQSQPSRTLADLAADARYAATGKRKTAVARVIIRPGSGQFELNGRPLEVYFPRRAHQAIVRQPLEIVGFAERVDVRARIHGGGISGQADAVRHGIAKALIEADPGLRGELKRRQLLTRDPREKERRKAGLKKARKRPQFSKR
jgi:small subunit ribosomal protein S9